MIFQWYFHDISMIFPWYSNDIPMIFQGYFNDIPMIFQWYVNFMWTCWPTNRIDGDIFWVNPQGCFGQNQFSLACVVLKSRVSMLQIKSWNSQNPEYRFMYVYIPPWTNIAPENGWLEDEISFWGGLFSGAMLVSGRVYIYLLDWFLRLKICFHVLHSPQKAVQLKSLSRSPKNFQACHRKVQAVSFRRYREFLIRDLPNPQTKSSKTGGTNIPYMWDTHSWTRRNCLISMGYGNEVGRIFHVQRVSSENTDECNTKEYDLPVTTPIKRWVICIYIYIYNFKKRVSSIKNRHEILRFYHLDWLRTILAKIPKRGLV